MLTAFVKTYQTIIFILNSIRYKSTTRKLQKVNDSCKIKGAEELENSRAQKPLWNFIRERKGFG